MGHLSAAAARTAGAQVPKRTCKLPTTSKMTPRTTTPCRILVTSSCQKGWDTEDSWKDLYFFPTSTIMKLSGFAFGRAPAAAGSNSAVGM